MRIFGELATAEQVSEINNLILKNFSLRRVIESVTILDTAKVINQVEQFCCAMSIWPGAMYLTIVRSRCMCISAV